MRVLLIDSEQSFLKAITPDMTKAGYQISHAKSGQDGLADVSAKNIEIAIIELHLPDMSGFEIIERLRRDPMYRDLPIIVITRKDELGDKLRAFDLGADDFLVKPFPPEELVARLRILARRGKAMKFVRQLEADRDTVSSLAVVHTLRGGIGCTSVAVNLALAFQQLWSKPTVLIDSVLTSGQVSMMLNAFPRATLEGYAESKPEAVDEAMIEDLSNLHKSGLHFVAAPRFPIATDGLTHEFWSALLDKFRQRYEFLVVDAPHDFSDSTIQILNSANYVVLLLSAEMASLRAAVSALHIYERLGFTQDKFKIVLNISVQNSGLRQAQLEKALGYPINYVLPYESTAVVRAVNLGEPFVLSSPGLAISSRLEDMAYALSSDIHKNIPPAVPSPTWKRVTGRISHPGTEAGSS